MTATRRQRRAFTIMEIVVALAGLAVALGLVVELAVWSTVERHRLVLRAEAVEAAANLLEAAQAARPEELTKDWAESRQLPPALAGRLKDGKLSVRIEPAPAPSRLVRVTASIAWQGNGVASGQPVVLSGWFGPRSAERKEKP